MKILIVIPAYQAAATLHCVFERLPAALDQHDVRILIVNDGSVDATATVADAIARSDGRVSTLHKVCNRGYAQALKSGLTAALEMQADVAVILHADGQYPPELLPVLLAPLASGEADIVQGSRMMYPWDALRGGMPLYKWVANQVLSRLENMVCGLGLAEYHSGYVLYSRRALTSIPFMRLSNTFHFDSEMMLVAGKRGLRIKQLPIPTRYAGEKSHVKCIPYGFAVLRILWRYKRGKYDFPMEIPK